jgi:NAD(P)H-hydrate repair Nnr-like enzyme with NAD(P)H-hydrate dehydratase domain
MPEIIYQNELPFPDLIWERPVHYFKHEAGKVFLLAGSMGVTNTAFLASEAIFRSGTGVLTLGFPEGIETTYKEVLPSSMVLPLPETPSGSVGRLAKPKILEQIAVSDIAVVGPDISTNAETTQLIWELIFEVDRPVVLTGDGVEALISGISILRSKESEIYLTEYFAKRKSGLFLVLYPGNMENLLGAMNLSSSLKGDPRTILPILSQYLAATVIYGGGELLIATPDQKLIVNKNIDTSVDPKNCDILAGIVGSFIAQNPSVTYKAVRTAVYLYGLSLELAKIDFPERALTTSDIIKYIPIAIKKSEDSD